VSDTPATKKSNWFVRHKFLTALIVLIIIIVAVSSANGSKTQAPASRSSQSSSSAQADTKGKTYRFADRADKQTSDIEVLPNEPATIDGVKLTTASVETKTSLSDYETADQGKTYVVATVNLENTSNRTQPYNVLDFRIQTPNGQVLDTTYGTVQSPLNSGDLVAGGKVSGQVVFQVPVVTSGHNYIIWKPGLASTRAVVQVPQQ
jgi:hypothetical protein